MAQSRAKKKVEQFIGPYLADFEKELLEKVEKAGFDRLDKLADQEEAFKNEVRRAVEAAENSRKLAENYQFKMQLNYLVAGAIGGAATAAVIFLFQAFIF